jgi:hypothetical protein
MVRAVDEMDRLVRATKALKALTYRQWAKPSSASDEICPDCIDHHRGTTVSICVVPLDCV